MSQKFFRLIAKLISTLLFHRMKNDGIDLSLPTHRTSTGIESSECEETVGLQDNRTVVHLKTMQAKGTAKKLFSNDKNRNTCYKLILFIIETMLVFFLSLNN